MSQPFFSLPSYRDPRSPNTSTLRIAKPQKKIIWAIGGGKGGIGKTLLTANMAVYLSWQKLNVTVIDLDLGGANTHTALGVNPPERGLADLIDNSNLHINDVAVATQYPNIQLISGAMDPIGITNLKNEQKQNLLSRIKDLRSDIILFDLGAGTTSSTVDFFLYGDKKIVVVTPEPTSIENAYRFIKAAYYHELYRSSPSPYIRSVIDDAITHKARHGIKTPKDLLNYICANNPQDGQILRNKMSNFTISLIVNQVRVPNEADIATSIQFVTERYFGTKVECCGFVPYDNTVWQSIRKRSPFLVTSPNSLIATHLERIAKKLLSIPIG